MALADMMARYPDELTCDMAETYGIFDIKRVPVQLLATLAVGLRENSRVKRALTKTKVDDERVLLAYIADCVAWLRWSYTEDGQKGVNHPPSMLDMYLEKEPKEADYELFSSHEEFKKRWAEVTRE